MCSWGGGPYSAASYTSKGIEKGMISKREEEEARIKPKKKELRLVYRESVVQVVDGREVTIISSDSPMHESSISETVKRIANS